jgi:hypothetical protein
LAAIRFFLLFPAASITFRLPASIYAIRGTVFEAGGVVAGAVVGAAVVAGGVVEAAVVVVAAGGAWVVAGARDCGIPVTVGNGLTDTVLAEAGDAAGAALVVAGAAEGGIGVSFTLVAVGESLPQAVNSNDKLRAATRLKIRPFKLNFVMLDLASPPKNKLPNYILHSNYDNA